MARYIWVCNWNNESSSWEDSARCIARSRKTVATEKLADAGLRRHQNSTGHIFSRRGDYRFGFVRKLGRGVRW